MKHALIFFKLIKFLIIFQEDSDLVFSWNSICMESNCTATSKRALAPRISGPVLEPDNPLRFEHMP
jgi:hypothetical protein